MNAMKSKALSKLAASRRRRADSLELHVDDRHRPTGDPRVDLAIVERRWTI